MKYALICLLALLGSLSLAQAQKTRRSEGTHQLRLTDSDLTEAEACQQCQELAMIEAIEKAFGRVIVQGNTTSVENIQTGESVETTQIFNMIAETYVNGEWVRTLDESCERFTEGGEFWIKCQVKGVVRELTDPEIDLQTFPLDCEQANCRTEMFQDGESLYLYLKSPVDGYVTIYLADVHTAQRLLPYRNMPEAMVHGLPVKADEEYILFSRAAAAPAMRGYVDEYELFAGRPLDQNRLYIVYSAEPLVKPALYRAREASDYDMPLQLATEDLQKWLAKQRRYQEVIQVQRLDISIRQ
ncbi:MAG: hypothetical protein D6722_15980 [Bacteroidetes bacterium]|nr:MAG: hypothetical protein D6722_15980 [Bacteroidota bacterium]